MIAVRFAVAVLLATWGAVIVAYTVPLIQPIHWAAGATKPEVSTIRTIQTAPCPDWAATLGRWGQGHSGNYQGSGSTGRWLQAKPHSWSETLNWPGAAYICGYREGAEGRYRHLLHQLL